MFKLVKDEDIMVSMRKDSGELYTDGTIWEYIVFVFTRTGIHLRWTKIEMQNYSCITIDEKLYSTSEYLDYSQQQLGQICKELVLSPQDMIVHLTSQYQSIRDLAKFIFENKFSNDIQV